VRSAAPNPFNPVTEIHCELPADGQVTLAVYDLGGHAVRNLLDESRSAGTFSVIWNGRDDKGRQVPSGVYFARLSAAGHESVLKLVLAK
jgi:flagellar hook assembly protein FlgD